MNIYDIASQIYAKLLYQPTNNQKKIVEAFAEYLVEGDSSSIFVLNGYAGTGKTTLVAAIVAALKNVGIRSVLLAPTGRAAKVLSHYSGEKSAPTGGNCALSPTKTRRQFLPERTYCTKSSSSEPLPNCTPSEAVFADNIEASSTM